MYIFVNKGLGMSPGKMAAQAAHAAVKASDGSTNELRDAWNSGGHYTKLVMQARDENHLSTIEKYLNDRGFNTFMIIDEGMTEIEPHQRTALGVAVVDKDDEHTSKTFSSFELYKPEVNINIKWS